MIRVLTAITVFALGATIGALDRRIVDTVKVGDAASEVAHGFAGEGVLSGSHNGVAYRQTSGWMHFALKTFEDTDVTLALTFAPTDSVSRAFDVVVEDSVIASRTFRAQDGAATTIELSVPFALTKGKPGIAVVVRAKGGTTPALRELRSIQDHYEQEQ